jgi:allophanate hydrolase subunit 2
MRAVKLDERRVPRPWQSRSLHGSATIGMLLGRAIRAGDRIARAGATSLSRRDVAIKSPAWGPVRSRDFLVGRSCWSAWMCHMVSPSVPTSKAIVAQASDPVSRAWEEIDLSL